MLSSIHSYTTAQGGELNLQAVFANRAVLLAKEPTTEDKDTLSGHSETYEKALGQFCQDQGINYNHTTYNDLAVPGPEFVNPRQKVEEYMGIHKGVWSPEEIISHLNDFLKSVGLPPHVEENGRNKKIIKKLHSLGGDTSSDEVYWLVSGYLAFDHLIPKLVGEGGMYIATERFEPLFGISNMTPDLKGMARLQLKA